MMCSWEYGAGKKSARSVFKAGYRSEYPAFLLRPSVGELCLLLSCLLLFKNGRAVDYCIRHSIGISL